MMRTRLAAVAAICCGLGLTACAAGAPRGPDVTVTAPAVGRPRPPVSVQAALSSGAFSPFAALGLSDEDGLAPRQSIFTLGGACMSAAGYPGASAGTVPVGIRIGSPAASALSQPWGAWGYLGGAQAQQYGFLRPPGQGLAQLGVDLNAPDLTSLPLAEQTAAGKCATIVQNFGDATQAGALAIITTLNNDLSNDVQHDAAVLKAAHAWTACMTKNGYAFHNPQDVFFAEIRATFGSKGPIDIGAPVSSSAGRAQIAAAVTDAACSDSTDLDGIYFAVQASYEQQLVNANQQALTAAVRRYRTAYARELRRLPALLRTAKAVPFGAARSKRAG
ncbi:MAG TPA: hypothetical protein VGG35_11905 [Streptosporangiaceae bacterium]